jgi:RNA polymerase sigma-70 factor, ECF subfamily
MKILSDEVIALLNKKQEAAFEVAFNLYYPRLVYFAKEYISDEDAKNAVQDAFISFWEKKPQLLSEYQLQSYLYTTVKNNCLMLLRHEKVKKNFEANKQIKIQNLLYTSALEQLDTSTTTFQEIEAIIEKTLSELPGRCREIFVLSRFEGRKNHEIASELNISEKAVEAQITKALKQFKIALKDFLPILSYIFISGQ